MAMNFPRPVSAAERRQLAHERHRAFLANVTGLRFGEPYLHPTKGLVFLAIKPFCPGTMTGFLVVESRVNHPSEFAS